MRLSYSATYADGPQYRWQWEVMESQLDAAHAQVHPGPAFHEWAARPCAEDPPPEDHLDGGSTARTLPSALHPGEVAVTASLRSSRPVC